MTMTPNSQIILALTLMIAVLPLAQAFSLGSCQTYSLDGTKCEQCITSYHLYDGKCYADILGCKIYNVGNICAQCDKDMILVNNYCCDRTCISQMYRQQDSSTNLNVVVQQSTVLQNLLLKINSEVFQPASIQNKLIGISYKKYQDVTRYFLLYEILNSSPTSTPYRRLVYDYHNALNVYIVADDSSLASQFDFQSIGFDIVKNLNQAQIILSQYPGIYDQIDPSLAIIKVAKLNKISQYEIVVHNQNNLKCYYAYLTKPVILYDITLVPEFFKVFLFGQYLDQVLSVGSNSSLAFITQCKALLEKNTSYPSSTTTSVKSLEIYNSSSVSEPLKVMFYSQNSTHNTKSIFSVYYSSVNVISNITLLSIGYEPKSTPTTWSSYFELQYPDINQILKLIFSGYNSTLDIPSIYVDDPNKRNGIEWQLKVEKWKIFSKYHLHLTLKNSTIEAIVYYFDFKAQYKIDRLVKMENTTSTVSKTVNNLSTNFTVTQTTSPYERTIQGWYLIAQRMLERDNIKSIVSNFTLRAEYKNLGVTANISRLTEKGNSTFIDYTFTCENETHYLKISLSNQTSTGLITVSNFNSTTKISKSYVSSFTSGLHTNESGRGVKVIFSQNTLIVIYTDMSYENASALENRLKSNWLKLFTGSYKSLHKDDYDLYTYMKNNTPGANVTVQMTEFHECPGSPVTQYVMQINRQVYNLGRSISCYLMYFLEWNVNGTKKIMHQDTVKDYFCNLTAVYTSGTFYNRITPKSAVLQNSTHAWAGYPNVGQPTAIWTTKSLYNAFDYPMSLLGTNVNNYFKSLVMDDFQLLRSNFYYYFSPYARYNVIRTDPLTGISFEFVSYVTNGYYRNNSLPTYSGYFYQQYHYVCPGISKYKLTNFNLTPQQSPWFNPVINDFYAAVVGKNVVLNTSFTQNTYSTVDSLALNSSLQQLQTILGSNVTVSSLTSRENLKIDFNFFKMYLQRLNVSTGVTTQDFMSLLNVKTNATELITSVPFFAKQLETFSLTKPRQYIQITNTSFYSSFISSDYLPYMNLTSVEVKINSTIVQQFLKILSLSSLQQPKFQISFKRVYVSNENLTNQSALINFIVEMKNLTYESNVYGQNTTLYKSYFTVPMLFKFNSTKNLTTNVTTSDSFIYLLDIEPIELNSTLSSFLIPSTVQETVIVKNVVSNFTVGYNFSFYSTQVANTSSTSTTPYINVVDFNAQNVSEGTQKFKDLVSDTGKILESGEIVEIKYFAQNIVTSTLPENADYVKIYDESINKLLSLVQTKFKEKLNTSNLVSQVLIIQKLTDSQGFKSYHLLLKVNVTYFSLSSGKQESVVHLIRFLYLSYKTYFTSMGQSFLPLNTYTTVLTDVKAEPNLYFQPLARISNMNYVQQFLYTTLGMINSYIVGLGSSEKAFAVNNVFYRNFLDGGFYKVVVSMKSGKIGIAYMLEVSYQYKIMNIELLQNTTVVNNTTKTTTTPTTNNTSLETQLNSSSTTSFYTYLQQIIVQLKAQYVNELTAAVLNKFTITESTDGQLYYVIFERTATNQSIYRDEVTVYRCNTTCPTYNGTNGSLYLIHFYRSEISTNATIISNSSYIITKASNLTSAIIESYYVSNSNSTNSSYWISATDEQSIISAFEQLINQQTVTTLDPKLLEYQKYIDFLKQYSSKLLGQNGSRILNGTMITAGVDKVISFAREKYLTFFSNSVVLSVVEEYRLATNQSKYSMYMLNEIPKPDGSKDWAIYKITVTVKQLAEGNFEYQIVSFTEFAKNGQLVNGPQTISTKANPQAIDIAFGFDPVNITDISNDPDFQFTLKQLQAKYSPLISQMKIKEIQRMELKNGTINFKFYFEDSTSGDQVKLIAVYKKSLNYVQILNKLYIPNDHYRTVEPTELESNLVLNNSLALIHQLHSRQVSSPFVTVTNVQTTSSVGSTAVSQKYRISFSLPTGKAFTSIVSFDPLSNSFIELSFSQTIEIPKDTSYRFNEFQELHAKSYQKIPVNQTSNEVLYKVAQNKVKSQMKNFTQSVLVLKKKETFASYYKIFFLANVTDALTNITALKLFDTLVFVDPISQVVEFKEKPFKVNFTEGFVPTLQTEISEQDLAKIVQQLRNLLSLTTEQVGIKQNLRKFFGEGLLLKLQLIVKYSSTLAKSYELLAFKSIYARNFSIWSVLSLVPPFQPGNSTNVACSLTSSCTKCQNPKDYWLTQNGVCARIMQYCQKIELDVSKDYLKCTSCMKDFIFLDEKCIAKQNYTEIFSKM